MCISQSSKYDAFGLKNDVNVTPILVCVDCELEWSDFGKCEDGVMTRRQLIVTQQVGAGRPCPEIQTEEKGSY